MIPDDDPAIGGPPPEPVPPGFVSTAVLLARARDGDDNARDQIARRYRSALLRWAHGRLPRRARDLVDTEDIVQSALVRALGALDTFEPRREGAYLAYLRQVVLNRIRDEARRSSRRPEHVDLDDRSPSPGPSPLDDALGQENMERYEAALARLTEMQREAVVLRVEMSYRYREIAEATGVPTANAARMLVGRGLVHLVRIMREVRHDR